MTRPEAEANGLVTLTLTPEEAEALVRAAGDYVGLGARMCVPVPYRNAILRIRAKVEDALEAREKQVGL